MFDFPCLSQQNKKSEDKNSEQEPYSKRKRNQSLTIGLECNHETDANRNSYT